MKINLRPSKGHAHKVRVEFYCGTNKPWVVETLETFNVSYSDVPFRSDGKTLEDALNDIGIQFDKYYEQFD